MAAMDPVTAVLNIGSQLIDRWFPDKAQADAAKLDLLKAQQAGDLAQMSADLQLATGQIEVNKVEAANASLFVSGWRPAVGWVCAAAFAFKFIGGPFLVFIAGYFGHPITLPVMDFTEMSTILFGMLGIGTLRTVEKVKGVA